MLCRLSLTRKGKTIGVGYEGSRVLSVSLGRVESARLRSMALNCQGEFPSDLLLLNATENEGGLQATRLMIQTETGEPVDLSSGWARRRGGREAFLPCPKTMNSCCFSVQRRSKWKFCKVRFCPQTFS